MVKLAIRLFDPNEVSHVQLVVKQLQNRVKDGFTLTNTSEADVIIISPNDPGFETLVKSRSGTKQPIVYGAVNTNRYYYFLKKPATTSGLLELLDQLRLHKSSHGNPGSDSSSCSSSLSALTQSPYLTALGTCKLDFFALEGATSPILVDSAGHRAVVAKELIQRSGACLSFLSSVSTAPDVKHSSRQQFEQAAKNAANRVISLDLLIWTVAIETASQFHIPEDLACRLKHWPDFTKLPYKRSFLKMAAVLTTRANTLEGLATDHQLPHKEIRSFIAGCAALNLLDFRAAVEKAPRNLPQGRTAEKRIIRKIVHRFFGVVGS